MTAYNTSRLLGPKAMITPEGGFAVRMINKTGGASIKGYAVQASSATDMGVSHIAVDVPNPIGIMYSSGVADGGEVWVVVAGPAHAYIANAATRNNIVRGYITADGGTPVAGQLLSEAFPASPFASDKHFYEIGHTLEDTAGAGLCLIEIHKN